METSVKRGRRPSQTYKSPIEKAVKELVADRGINIKQLSTLTRLDESTFYKFFASGLAAAETIEKIANALGVHPKSLDQFNGLSPFKEDESSYVQVNVNSILPYIPKNETHLYVPFYDLDITAGNFDMYPEFAEAPVGFIYAPEFTGCIACKVRGDSMYKRIMPGATIFVQHQENKKYIDYGQIYVLVLDGLRPVKYIFPHEDEDRILLVSENQEKYPSWSVEKTDVIHLFLVKGYINQNAN